MIADSDRVDDAIAQLSEHFDTVQILVTRHDAVGTANIIKGSGNFFARIGQVKDWIVMQDAVSREEVVKEEE